MPNATAMLNTLLRSNASRHNTIAGWVVTGLILIFATTNFFSKTRWNRSFQLVRAYPL